MKDYIDLLDNLFPWGPVEKGILTVFFVVFTWLFNEFKKQFDADYYRNQERVDRTIVALTDCIDILNREKGNNEINILSKLSNILPYVNYKTYKILKDLSITNDPNSVSIVISKLQTDLSILKLRSNYINNYNQQGYLEKIEHIFSEFKRILIPLFKTIYIVLMLLLFGFFYIISNGNPFVTTVRISSFLLLILFLFTLIDLINEKKLLKERNNYLAFSLFFIATLTNIIITNIWSLVLGVTCIVIGFKIIIIKQNKYF